MSFAVLVDSQFSVAHPYRPFEGFETVYQGQPVDIPIAIPGTLDRDAGNTGFDPNLLAGIPLPFGSKLTLWFPTIFNVAGQFITIQPYRYSIVWRLRNLRDFRVNRAAYHFPQQSFGENNQFVIPAAAEGMMFEQDPMTSPAAQPPALFDTKRSATHEFAIEEVEFRSAVPVPPLTPAGNTGAFQQGLAAANVGSNNSVTFNQVQFDALGDEFMILITRNVGGALSETWDFTSNTQDAGLSRFFGTDNGSRGVIQAMGVYVLTGSNP